MPVPAAILQMGRSAHLCGAFALPVNTPSMPRAQLTRNFHVYLELTMQSKHDANMRAYCQTVQVEGRRQDGNQVPNSGANGPAALAIFYVTKSQKAAEVTRDLMMKKWKLQKAGAPNVYTPGVRVDASIQKDVQSDNYQYEISFWYDNQDIYVLYHCYPSR
jgi:hypothetical protein